MELIEALEKVNYSSKEEPILRVCCDCKTYLDEASETIAKYREIIKHELSHGFCQKCFEKHENY